MEPSHDTPRLAATPSAPPLAIIAAVAANGVIGDGNRLPWRLPEDLKRFRALTTGHAVIMGRRTWESIGRPLPGRQNIVVTRSRAAPPAGTETAVSLDQALALVRMPAPAFCIGGGELYREALPRATTLHLTEIARAFAGDTRFPPLDAGDWRETAREPGAASGADQFDYAFVTYERIAR
ncbi:MAG: dihydrofolate reductase [Betaproteobacteria bacterium]